MVVLSNCSTCLRVTSKYILVRFNSRNAYRLKPGAFDSKALDVNKSDETKYQENVNNAMLHKQRSPLRGFETVSIAEEIKKKFRPLPNEGFYFREDLPTYGSYVNYVKAAEREKRKQRKEGVHWKTMDHWWKKINSVPNYVNIGEQLPSQKRSEKEIRQLKKELHQIKQDPKREKAARKRLMTVDIEKSLEDWETSVNGAIDIHQIALHYNVFKDLFGHAYFYPIVHMDIGYDIDNDSINPVYYGNEISPAEASFSPNVEFSSEDDQLWSLILTNPDGNLEDNTAEYVHWFVSNIRGSDISTGDTLVDYLPPIPARGTGYHRMVFILFRQTKEINFSAYKKALPCLLLRERSFKIKKVVKEFHSELVPVSLRFFQSKWDKTVQDTYHSKLDMPEPVFDFIPTCVNRLGALKLWPHKKTLTWLQNFMPKEPIYPGGGQFQ